jgi:thioredoxin reductase (NADPH)
MESTHSTDEIKDYDLIIIGGGPAGLAAGLYAARGKLKTVIMDKSQFSGALAYTNKIENYPGVGPISGIELLNNMRKQAIDFGAEYREHQVIGVDIKGEPKKVITMSGQYTGRAVIIATGAMGRRPTLKGEEEFLGKGVSYCASCDAAFFGGKVAAIIGSSVEALEEADAVARYAKKVYIISPHKKLPQSEEDQPVLKNDKVEVLTGIGLKAIYGDEIVKGITVRDSSGKESNLEADGVFIYLQGTKPVTDFLADSLDLTEEGCIEVDREMRTTIDGVFAAGDVICKRVRQAIIASAEGCIAALSAERYLYHKKGMVLDWMHDRSKEKS